MRFVLALDQGTTSSRAIVFDERGAICGAARRELTQHFPRPGWVEHDPAEIFASQRDTAREALRAAGLSAGDCVAAGIANQRETTVLWDRRTGEPLHRAIVWQDRRTAPLCEALRERGLEPSFREKTGLVLDPYFSGTKLAWLLDNLPGARERALRGELAFGTIDSWLVWKFTGGAVHATDVTNASRTLLMDLEALAWSDELLAALDIPRAVLPEIRPSAGDFGMMAAEYLGVPLRIAAVAGDQHAALAGQAGFARGVAKCTFGTGAFLVLNTGDEVVRSRSGLLTTVAFSTQPGRARYALEGSIFVTGAAVQWLRDGLGLIAGSDGVESLAASVPDAGGAYFVPAFAGLGAPYWDPHARGAIVGLTRGTSGAHLARATLEAMAYQTVDVVRAMERDAGIALAELRVDGGASRNDLAMQLCADMLGADVVRPRITETTALGAAYLAGIAAGVWRHPDEVARQWAQERRFVPSCTPAERERSLSGWHRAIECAARWSAPE